MKLFDGLYPYEVLLIVLGVAMFCALLAILIYLVTKGRPLVGLFPFFLLALVMIAVEGGFQ